MKTVKSSFNLIKISLYIIARWVSSDNEAKTAHTHTQNMSNVCKILLGDSTNKRQQQLYDNRS